jgi:hypothetical protein
MISKLALALRLARLGLDPASILVRLDLHTALRHCESLLDVGCGPRSTLKLFGFQRLIGVEGYEPSVNEARANRTHDEIVQGDIRNLPEMFGRAAFDAAIAIDVIEHLPKDDGLKLMQSMEGVARKVVVFYTPSGFLQQRHATNDDLQEHLSGWEPDEMRKHGYDVTGSLGPKILRGEYHVLKKRPHLFWGIVSMAGHLFYTKKHPESAAAILCVKQLSR